MACWSAENATRAYLNTLKMGQKAKEPAVAEFISALAAGNNAQQMVVGCSRSADSTILLALVAAANQTGGQVICIVPSHEDLIASKHVLGTTSSNSHQQVQLIVGEAQRLMLSHFQGADFVLIDCNLVNHEGILRAIDQVCGSKKQNGTLVVGYNAFGCKGSWIGSRTQLLPIGEGLFVTRFGANANNVSPSHGSNNNNHRMVKKIKSHSWVVKVDKCTGEEHVFRVRFPQGKVIQA